MKIDLTICGAWELSDQMGKPWTHVISIWEKSLEQDPKRREIVRLVAPQARYHFAFFEDTTNRLGPDAPTLADVEKILDFTRKLPAEAKVLVHCQAGVSRSPAIAYAIVCQHSNPGEEGAGLDYIKSIRPLIVPNELIVALADQLLQREGQMSLQLGPD
jgi:predicted protein tyrosine phosphatase